jgi:excisionase family DNA binding protein
MQRPAATQRPVVEILGRPERGPGETRPCVSPGGAGQAKREVIATLHQLIDTLTALEDEPRRDDASGVGQNLPLLLDAVEAGELLSISRAKVLDMAARGQIPSIRVGGSVRIPRDMLLAWIADNSTAARSISSVRVLIGAHADQAAQL